VKNETTCSVVMLDFVNFQVPSDVGQGTGHRALPCTS
jgi:hypothetical protein